MDNLIIVFSGIISPPAFQLSNTETSSFNFVVNSILLIPDVSLVGFYPDLLEFIYIYIFFFFDYVFIIFLSQQFVIYKKFKIYK